VRTTIAILSITACAGALVALAIQRGQIRDLREQQKAIITAVEPLAQNRTPVSAKQIRDHPIPSPRPSLELVRLRGQVAQLMARQRELASEAVENTRLREQLASQRTNTTQLPPGYLRKSQMRMSGFRSPEDTLQTFLWAMHNRDTQRVVEALSPESAEKFLKQVERLGSEEKLYDEFAMFPGMRILGRHEQPDGSVRLNVEIIPGQPANDQIRLRNIGGNWKLDFF
jgi:hypothetical protein